MGPDAPEIRASRFEGSTTRPLVIDTDPGIDDALALLFAWGSPETRVEALTTVAGNVPLDVGTVNVFRLVHLCRPDPVPVVATGAPAPLARPLVTATRYHGQDGLGDLPDWPDVAVTPARESAAEVIVEMARRHGERLTLVPIGPLTNVALALERDPAALARVGRVVIMGGAVDVPGNVTPTAEFNAHVDPEASARVFAADLPIDLVPLDATRQAVLPRARLEQAVARAPGAIAERVAGFTRHAFRVEREADSPGMLLHDPLAVALAILDREDARGYASDLVDWRPAHLTIGPQGETRRGSGPPNCRVALRVHTERFLAVFLDRLMRSVPRR